MKKYVQLNVTGRKRDKRTGLLFKWCHTCPESKAQARKRALIRSKHVLSVQIVEVHQ